MGRLRGLCHLTAVRLIHCKHLQFKQLAATQTGVSNQMMYECAARCVEEVPVPSVVDCNNWLGADLVQRSSGWTHTHQALS